MLGISYKSAWFVSMRLREAMTEPKAGPIGGKGKVVESDETFVGGKKKNVHKGKPESCFVEYTLPHFPLFPKSDIGLPVANKENADP
jgi:hypothetical protein